MLNYVEVTVHIYRSLDASHNGMKFIFISLWRPKQVRIFFFFFFCNRALFILHKNVKPSHFHDVIVEEVFVSHPKETI